MDGVGERDSWEPIALRRRQKDMDRQIERRTLLSALVGAPVLAVVATACGSDSASAPVVTGGDTLPAPEPVADTVPTTQLPTSGPPVTSAGDAPAPDVVLEYGSYGGFTMRDVAFQRTPQLLVTGDLRVITPALTTAVYPGPLVPPLVQRSITAAGVETILAAAADAGLYADVDYESDEMLADASTATLRLAAEDRTYVHEAYALGMGGGPGGGAESSPERQALADFVARISDLPALVGDDQLGPEEPFVPEAYQILADRAGDSSGAELEPTVVDWPADTGVALADVTGCTEIAASALDGALDGADQLTYFADGGVTYVVVVRPALPGRDCSV